MSSPDDAILSFDIVIDAKLSGDTEKEIEKLEKLKTLQEETKGSGEGEGETAAKSAKDDSLSPEVVDMLNNMDTTELEQFIKMGKNPIGSLTKILEKILGSNITKLLGAVGIAILAVEIGKEVIRALSVKGGPLNRDWRRFIADEVEIGLSRVQQKEKELGVSQVILTQVIGFQPNNENWTYNSLFDRNSLRYARIGLSDREAGVTMIRG